jgi:hypothetical protein
MRNALLLLLMTLTGGPVGHDAEVESTAIEASASIPSGAILSVEEILGAWRGQLKTDAGASVPVEIIFRQGIRPRTAFAYVTLVERAGERTIRRPARLTDGGLEFELPGRAGFVLHAEGDGKLVAPGLTLNRLRQ